MNACPVRVSAVRSTGESDDELRRTVRALQQKKKYQFASGGSRSNGVPRCQDTLTLAAFKERSVMQHPPFFTPLIGCGGKDRDPRTSGAARPRTHVTRGRLGSTEVPRRGGSWMVQGSESGQSKHGHRRHEWGETAVAWLTRLCVVVYQRQD